MNAKPDRSLKIACIGEAMIEMVADSNYTKAALGVAGDSMNTAIYLRRALPAGHDVSFVSMVGEDGLSQRIRDFIAGEGVSVDLLASHPEKLPGLYLVNTDDAGERSFSYWRASSAARVMFTKPHGHALDVLDRFDFTFASAISLAIMPQDDRNRFFDWLDKFRATGGQFIFDSNFRPALWPDLDIARREVSRAWSFCDIALPSIDDEMKLFGDADEAAVLNRLRSTGVKAGVLKRGREGPVPIAVDDQPFPPFPKADRVVDTTAAGDSFNGSFLASYLINNDLLEAAKAGHAMAIHVVGHNGAIVSRP